MPALEVRKGQNEHLKKARQVVVADGSAILSIQEQKLFNFLHFKASRDMVAGRIHRVSQEEAMQYAGITTLRALKQSLYALGTATITLPEYEKADGSHTVTCHFISYEISNAENGFINFAFDPILLEIIRDPKIYARINMKEAERIFSPYAARLYERMMLLKCLVEPTWVAPLEKAKSFFGCEASRTDNFMQKVVQPAVDEVNEKTSLKVTVEKIKGGRGGQILSLKFHVSDRTKAPVIRKAKVKARDLDTIDLIDGISDRERVEVEMPSEQAFQIAQKAAPDMDVDRLEKMWRRSLRGRAVDSVDLSFIEFVEAEVARRKDDLLRDLDDDVLGMFLSGNQ